MENDKLWEEGIMKVMFKDGNTFRLLLDFFKDQGTPYIKLANLLAKRLSQYYETL